MWDYQNYARHLHCTCSKTVLVQFMVFSLRKHIITNTDMCINNQILDRVEHTMFLGVILDSHLTWSYHIQHVKIKIAKSIGILCRARKVHKRTTLITLYYAFIYPYLTYCVEVWGSAAKVHIASVEKVQKLACRINTSMPPRTSSALLFTMLNFLNFNQGRSVPYARTQVLPHRFDN